MMPTEQTLFVIANAILFAHCALVAGLLAFERHGRRDRLLWLSLFFGLYALKLLSDLIVLTDLDATRPSVLLGVGVVAGLLLLLAPAIFLHARSMLSPAPITLSRRTLAHGLPALFALAILVPLYGLLWLIRIGSIDGSLKDVVGFTIIDAGIVERAVIMVQFAVYLFACVRLVRRHLSGLRDFLSTIEDSSVSQARYVILFAVSFWGIYLSQFVGAFPRAPEEQGFGPIWMLGALVLYVFGIFAIRRPAVFETALPDVSPAAAELPYERSPLTDADVRRISDKLDRAMRIDLAYREPALTLRHLSERTRVSEHKISQVLNVHLGRSFFSYVNGWRIAEAQRLLTENPKRTVQDIFQDVGFNSKSTFNKAFREITGKTPSMFRGDGDAPGASATRHPDGMEPKGNVR